MLQARRESAVAAVRATAVEREAERAVAEERSRIARDLHDIVSHNLSVVVVQAAGARAQAARSGVDTETTLEKIEASGRNALTEMRRLLGVLRADDEPNGSSAQMAPAPGIGDLDALAHSVRQAGVGVSLTVDTADVAPVLDISAYRIVQEALTNVLKHAGPGAHADVTIREVDHQLDITVIDDGRGPSTNPGLGHGLRGMRERVSLLGGELIAGGRPDGGFAVAARLPVETQA